MALTEKLTAIANAIRAKTGGSAGLTLQQMADAITGLSTGDGEIPDGYIQPSGAVLLTQNGTYDVRVYASATVGVPGQVEGVSVQEGDFTLEENVSAVDDTYTFTHNLGRTPSVVILLCKTKTSSGNSLLSMVWTADTQTCVTLRHTALGTGGTGSAAYNTLTLTDTAATITLVSANGSLRKGDSYHWICW